MPNARLDRRQSRLICLLAYLVAACVGVTAAWILGGGSLLRTAAVADLAATVVVFVFSVALDNSSMYDPYWSVAPVPILAFWLASGGGVTARQIVVLALVAIWAVRLTMNWLRRWRGLADEDWRYANYRRLGAAYWPVSFLGFHLFPTVIVFLGCAAIFPAFIISGSRAVGILDLAAVAVTLTAILIEAEADRQLWRFLATRKSPGKILDTGLWALSRHPNYFGEVLFWWGAWLFGLAANPAWWWTIIGPVAVTGLFLGISVPMMDKRMLQRHPGYAELIATRSAFLPLPLRRAAQRAPGA
jgi:steroid 5-alpha reductase family enzyme